MPWRVRRLQLSMYHAHAGHRGAQRNTAQVLYSARLHWSPPLPTRWCQRLPATFLLNVSLMAVKSARQRNAVWKLSRRSCGSPNPLTCGSVSLLAIHPGSKSFGVRGVTQLPIVSGYLKHLLLGYPDFAEESLPVRTPGTPAIGDFIGQERSRRMRRIQPALPDLLVRIDA